MLVEKVLAMSDLRQAIRAVLDTPAFSALLVLVLAVGIGATSTIFSVLDAVLLKPLPFPEPSRLVAITGFVRGEEDNISLPDLRDWQAQSKTFAGLAGYSAIELTLTGRGPAVSVQAAATIAELFRILDARPLLGRTLIPEDDQRRMPVAVISERMWASRFNRGASVLGERLVLDGRPLTIVGVLPASFEFPVQADPIQVWVPVSAVGLANRFAEQRGAHFLSVVGRLSAGATVDQANAELDGISKRLAVAYPGSDATRTAKAFPLQERLVGNFRLVLIVLAAAVALVLLIACGNAANLLLVRGTTRSREMAIRSAMGAPRWRLVRQLLTESVLLSTIAGALGIVLAIWAVSTVTTTSPFDLPRLRDARVDALALSFITALSVATGVVFGLAPAVQLSGMSDAHVLQDAAHGSTGRRAARTRQGLVVAEVALSVVLLGSAGLLIRSLVALQHVDPGFVADRVLGTGVLLPDAQFSDPPSMIAVTNRLLVAARQVPGVSAAGVTTTIPMTGSDLTIGFDVEDHPAPPGERPSATYFAVSPDYFRTMGIRVLNGRAFTEHDDARGHSVILISDTMARRYWPRGDALGKRITIGYNNTGPREIVGIVADVKNGSLADAAAPSLYTPFEQTPWPVVGLVVRTNGDSEAVRRSLATALARTAPDLPLEDVLVLSTFVAKTTAAPRFLTTVVSTFASFALLLAGCGLFSVMAYSVAQRRREIGIRMALGAAAADVRALVVGQAVRLGALGLALGLAGALAAGRLLESLLFQVRPVDPVTLVGVSVMLGLIVVIAASLPARRAVRVHPAQVLRAD
jgi:putative ABC transport system permease protein